MADVVTPRELAELMAEFGLSRVRVGDVELERPAFSVGAVGAKGEPGETSAEDEEPEAEPDRLEEILRMTPEQQDRALRLGKSR
jgi:hypothetical protein